MDTPATVPPRRRPGSGPTPRLPRLRLDTVTRVRQEIARVYVEARHKRLDVQDAARLANILALVGRLIEGAELERRIQVLERARTGQGRP